MNKITTEFQDGQILHAADLNPLITSINQAADELATKASQLDLDNTTSTANNALTAANNAATVATDASETAGDAYNLAHQSRSTAAQALATATNAQTEALRRLLMVEFDEIVERVAVNQSSISSVDAVCYNKTTMTFVAKVAGRYYNNWPNAQEYGSTMMQNGWEPKKGVIYYLNGNIFIYDGAALWKTQMDMVI